MRAVRNYEQTPTVTNSLSAKIVLVVLHRMDWRSQSQSGRVVAEVLVREVAIRTKQDQGNGKSKEMQLADGVGMATQGKEDSAVTSRLQSFFFFF